MILKHHPKELFAELKWQTFPERVIYNSNSNIQDMSRLS